MFQSDTVYNKTLYYKIECIPGKAHRTNLQRPSSTQRLIHKDYRSHPDRAPTRTAASAPGLCSGSALVPLTPFVIRTHTSARNTTI